MEDNSSEGDLSDNADSNTSIINSTFQIDFNIPNENLDLLEISNFKFILSHRINGESIFDVKWTYQVYTNKTSFYETNELKNITLWH